MGTRTVLLSVMLLTHAGAGAFEPDFVFSDSHLHGDGSITFSVPRRRVGDEYFRVDRGAAYALCGAIGFGETMQFDTEKPIYGTYRAVTVDWSNRVRGPESSGEVVRAVRCAPTNGVGGPGRGLLD